MAYSKESRRPRTTSTHSVASADCSPNRTAGRRAATSFSKTGQRCRSSANPCFLPARENGWHRQACGPNRSIVSPADAAQREGPAADAGEEVRRDVSFEIVRTDFLDVSPVDVAGRQSASCDEPLEPPRRVLAVFIVVDPRSLHSTPLQLSRLGMSGPAAVQELSTVSTGSHAFLHRPSGPSPSPAVDHEHAVFDDEDAARPDVWRGQELHGCTPSLFSRSSPPWGSTSGGSVARCALIWFRRSGA